MEEYNITGFHGTFEDRAENIIAEGFKVFEAKITDNYWLGHGIYFFDNYDLSFNWAKQKAVAKEKKGKKVKPVVIKATIQSNKENVLDLDDPFQLSKFKANLDEYEAELKKLNFNIKSSEGLCGKDLDNNLRCFCFDYYKNVNNINIIIYSFQKRKPAYGYCKNGPISQIFEVFTYLEKQICVSNTNSIKNIHIYKPLEMIV